MSEAVQQLLDSFDTLAEADEYQAAIEILRRFPSAERGGLPDEALLGAADELFRDLDDEETRHTPR